jgi:SAM-dependent methyltransferase
MLKLRDAYGVFNKGVIGKILFSKFPANNLKILQKTNVTKYSRILDVGCGSGLLLYRLRNLGFSNCTGLDPFITSDIIYKNGLTIYKNEVINFKGQWDLIMLHHSFEHVPNPLETFQSVSRLLAKDGQCLIRIPIVPSYAWEHYRTNWVQLDAPRHFFLHSLESIRILAKNSGLEVKDIEYDSSEFQFVGSELYLKDIPLRHLKKSLGDIIKSNFSNREIKNYKEMAKKLNANKQGDQAAFILSKI